MRTKLEAGKHYKTRGGAKVLVIRSGQKENDPWPFMSHDRKFYFKNCGFSCSGSIYDRDDSEDIISEWHEPESSGVDATLSQRQKTHGEFSDHARIAQELKGCLIPVRGELPDMHREALDMICHKMARILAGNSNEPDHWHDIAGYATLVEKEVKNGMADN